MKAYHDIVKEVISTGTRKPSRTGIDTISGFSYLFKHDLRDGFPLLTTKKMDGKLWNSIVHELLWFLSGENHIRNLKEKTGIWNEWADKEGNLETAYGFYWRNFPHVGGKMQHYSKDMNADYGIGGSTEAGNFDQVSWIINELKKNPLSRRMVCSAWEPKNATSSKLPPCHFCWVVNVQNGRLCLQWIMRSVDLFLGFPFNIASYSLLCHLLANEAGLEPGIVSCNLIDAHIYVADKDDETPIVTNPLTGETAPRCEFDHLEKLKVQMEREPLPLPSIKIAKKPIFDMQFEDIELIGYQSHGPLRARVAV